RPNTPTTPEQKPGLAHGVLVNMGYHTSRDANLLDITPKNAIYEPLVVGRTFSNTDADVHITPIRVRGTTVQSIDVMVNVGPFPSNLPPTVTVEANAESVPVGTTVKFRATATDPDGDALAYFWD